MKIRQGFVSNSSSCSFTISLAALTPVQLALIEQHRDATQWMTDSKMLDPEYMCDNGDEWEIKIDTQEGVLNARTHMDNFDLIWFANSIGVNNTLIKNEGQYYLGDE